MAFEARFEDPDGVRAFARLTYRGVPDFKVTPVRIIASEEEAAAWVMSGTLSGDLPNLSATGKTFEVRASSIIRVRAGLQRLAVGVAHGNRLARLARPGGDLETPVMERVKRIVNRHGGRHGI